MTLALRMKVTTMASWSSIPKSSYKKLCYNTLNNPYWHEKGLVASFDLPQQILTCQRNCGFILKQMEKRLDRQQLYRRNSGCNMESTTSAPPIHANNQAMQHMAYSQWYQYLVFHND